MNIVVLYDLRISVYVKLLSNNSAKMMRFICISFPKLCLSFVEKLSSYLNFPSHGSLLMAVSNTPAGFMGQSKLKKEDKRLSSVYGVSVPSWTLAGSVV